MANTRIQHYTLQGSTVKTVTLDKDYHVVEVVNVDGASAVYFTIDNVSPTVAGDDCEVLPAAIGALQVADPPQRVVVNPTVVKLISAGTPKVSVKGVA